MRNTRFGKILPLVAVGFGLTACDTINNSIANLDFDLRGNAGGLDTSDAARQATLARPEPDARGVISYSSYQVAVARRGDTPSSIATRVGGNPQEIARLNGLNAADTFIGGETLVLPASLPAPAAPATTGNGSITQIATSAIDRAPARQGGIAPAQASKRIDGPEPLRHRVERGETAYTIARLYNVPVRSLADWNGLGPDLEVRVDQFLLIPVVNREAQVTPVAAAPATAPGQGTQTPTPPSASTPLPAPVPAAKAPESRTPESAKPEATAKPRFTRPVSGQIIRPYKKGKNEGIDIAAATGTPVAAAADGVVAAITRDTEQVPILVMRHPNNVLTVYANISAITVKKGDRVRRGQRIAQVGTGSPAFLHFEIREGFESVNPQSYFE